MKTYKLSSLDAEYQYISTEEEFLEIVMSGGNLFSVYEIRDIREQESLKDRSVSMMEIMLCWIRDNDWYIKNYITLHHLDDNDYEISVKVDQHEHIFLRSRSIDLVLAVDIVRELYYSVVEKIKQVQCMETT